MKTLNYFIVVYILSRVLISCNQSEDIKPQDKVLNYEMNCDKDSTYYYYVSLSHKIYLDLSTLCITIKFSDTVSEEYLNTLIEKNSELDSISFIIKEENLAYGYLKAEIACEEIKSLLKRLTLENQILCVNPNFLAKECTSRGNTSNDEDCLMGLSNEFVVENRNLNNLDRINSLVLSTKTTLLRYNQDYAIISADKYSKGNCLEMSRYFYENGHFGYCHPNFLVEIVFFKENTNDQNQLDQIREDLQIRKEF